MPIWSCSRLLLVRGLLEYALRYWYVLTPTDAPAQCGETDAYVLMVGTELISRSMCTHALVYTIVYQHYWICQQGQRRVPMNGADMINKLHIKFFPKAA
ncbi:unnamed protein product [Rodentolepis nana]|uniref:Secreted protein n=1 Tax=Rodentolepis nana TaxID=102285 RepID=A0A0R3TMB3_RODNA|nr:unnamed protein product [Rodentolepis nana]